MTIEMRIPSYEAAWARVVEDPAAHRMAGHDALQRGIANALVRFSSAGVNPNLASRMVIATAARMVLWSMDPQAGAQADAHWLASDIEVRRGDQ